MATVTIWSVYLMICCSQISSTGGYDSRAETSPTKQRYQYSHHVQWSCLNSTAEDYNSCNINPDIIKCHESGPSLLFGNCATYDKGKLSIYGCSHYFLPSSYQNVSVPGFVPLPIVITELNYSMYHPMNRKGVICSECMDGYGPSLTSHGYRCVKCADTWYRIPLLLIYELLPITVFYIIVLVFRISVTTPPIPCFIMYAQFIVIFFGYFYPSIHVRYGFMDKTQVDNVMQTLYGIFNLDFFSLILPPSCISSKLQLIHITFLGYVSVFYPQFLIL